MTGVCGGGTWKFHGTLAVLRHFLENLKIFTLKKKQQNSVAVFSTGFLDPMGLRGRSKSSSFQFSPQKKRHVHLFGTNWNAQTRQGSLWTFLKGEISRCRTCGRMSYHQTEVQPQSEMAAGEFHWFPKKRCEGYRYCLFFDVTLKIFCDSQRHLFFLLLLYIIARSPWSL